MDIYCSSLCLSTFSVFGDLLLLSVPQVVLTAADRMSPLNLYMVLWLAVFGSGPWAL